MRQNKFRLIVLSLGIKIVFLPILCYAQANIFLPNQNNMSAARYEINTKRIGINFNSKEALTAGKEFERIDSSYYVGFLLQGTFMFNQSADYFGYANTIPILQKSLGLIEKDFDKKLRTRSNNIADYVGLMGLHQDYDYLTYCLSTCYANVNKPDSAWYIIRKAQSLDLQDEMYMDTYNSLAWIVHRNRFYTKEKYSFLKNSLAENESYASDLLDSSVLKINRDATVNANFYADYARTKMGGVYHYRAMLSAYALDIKSADKYFNLQKESASFSFNNYANYCGIKGLFGEAEMNYRLAAMSEGDDKKLKEYIYYQSIINTYKGETKQGATTLNEFIKANGSTSGFGWYNIALARTLLYDGQFVKAQKYVHKATQFKEVHIGTTLGESHYNFTNGIMQWLVYNAEYKSISFVNKNWWYSMKAIGRKIKLYFQKFITQYFLVSQFSANPERENVVYALFSTESTISFDEVWYIMQDFSTGFFIEKLQAHLRLETRPNIKKYYKLLLAKLFLKENNYEQAVAYCNDIVMNENIDANYEKLFYARLLEVLVQINLQNNDEVNAAINTKKMYEIYPQLIPFSNVQVKMQLVVSGNTTIESKQVLASLKNANINWVETADSNTAIAYIDFMEIENVKSIQLQIKNTSGNTIVPQTKIGYATVADAEKVLPFCLFHVGIFNGAAN